MWLSSARLLSSINFVSTCWHPYLFRNADNRSDKTCLKYSYNCWFYKTNFTPRSGWRNTGGCRFSYNKFALRCSLNEKLVSEGCLSLSPCFCLFHSLCLPFCISVCLSLSLCVCLSLYIQCRCHLSHSWKLQYIDGYCAVSQYNKMYIWLYSTQESVNTLTVLHLGLHSREQHTRTYSNSDIGLAWLDFCGSTVQFVCASVIFINVYRRPYYAFHEMIYKGYFSFSHHDYWCRQGLIWYSISEHGCCHLVIYHTKQHGWRCTLLYFGFIVASRCIHVINLPPFFRIASLTLADSQDYFVSVMLKDIVKIDLWQNTTKHNRIWTTFIILAS